MMFPTFSYTWPTTNSTHKWDTNSNRAGAGHWDSPYTANPVHTTPNPPK